MRFVVLRRRQAAQEPGTCWLIRDNWDDFHFQTSYVVILDVGDRRYELGTVKIGQRGLPSGATPLADAFEFLPLDYFSLGQEESYYETLALLDAVTRRQYLEAMRDVVLDTGLRTSLSNEPSFTQSLCRFVSDASMARYRDVLLGTQDFSGFGISYSFSREYSPTRQMTFRVDEAKDPPSNVHVVIGRNGAGKTRFLNDLVTILTDPNGPGQTPGRGHGHLQSADNLAPQIDITSLVNISFSAFDVFAPPLESNRGTRLRYTYIGLRHPIERASDTPVLKSADDLRTDFVDAARRCNSSALRETWVTALATLSSDPGFAALNLQDLQSDDGRRFDSQAGKLFDEASSGHKIVLSTIAQLIAAVNDRTLVLIDEPEAHLHPPLMASYVRTMSAILASRNGMAIVATHSPVFLQEVQASCAWILNRSNKVSSCFRPGIETYAEAIGILTREVFQLEVSHSGHHARIAEVCETATSLADVVAAFGGSLGSEGRAIAISILGSKSSQ